MKLLPQTKEALNHRRKKKNHFGRFKAMQQALSVRKANAKNYSSRIFGC